MNPAAPILLGDAHKRGITAALAGLDHVLCEFDEYARGRETRSIFFEEHNDMSDARKKNVMAAVWRMRRVLRRLKTDLALVTETVSVARKIRGSAALSWESLVDTTSGPLKRYGDYPAGLPEYLDPLLESMIRDLQELGGVEGPIGAP